MVRKQHSEDFKREAVKLAPWIHVESDVKFYSPLYDGEQYETRAIVTDNRDYKGHLMVDLDSSSCQVTGPLWAVYIE